VEPQARTDYQTLQQGRISLKLRFRFRRFRSRILFFFLGLLGLVLASVFIAVDATNMRSAQERIEEELKVTERIFFRLIESRIQRLEEGAYLLSSDFAFKQSVASEDYSTIFSALENIKARINAEVITLVSVDYTVVADTLHPDSRKETFPFSDIIKKAEEEGEAFAIVFIDNRAYQMVVTPILAPMPIGWLCISFEINESLLKEIQKITLSYISLFRLEDGDNLLDIASTLPPLLSKNLHKLLPSVEKNLGKSILLNINEDVYVSAITPISQSSHSTVLAVLQRSLQDALKPYLRLRASLIALSAGAILISMVGGIFIARTVSRPVLILVRGVREIGKGNYEHRVTLNQQDEIGEMADAFNQMSEGLLERDRVRNLLGKVVSPAVATELLSRKEIKLGGEERMMTAFFSDIAGFTSISEKREPAEIVELLNEYLSAMADIVYEFGGTVDKYIGDAIVAFWGAPLPEENHPELCARAAVAMQKKLIQLRASWGGQGKSDIFMRVGINTGKMVVGNIGSKDRLDYTMIGDAVNLASRLEGSNKYYGTNIMISQFTQQYIKKKFLTREVDIVRVQGKEEPIRIFEVIDHIENTSEEQRHVVQIFEQALNAFRKLDLKKAEGLFKRYEKLSQTSDKTCELYLQRIAELTLSPPSPDWDRVYPLDK